MVRFVLFGAALLAAGCAQQPRPQAVQYATIKPGASQAEVERDIAQCRYEAAAASNPGYIPPARTYGGAVAQGIDVAVQGSAREAQLMSLCLSARGFRTVATGAGDLIECPYQGRVAYVKPEHCAELANQESPTVK